MFIQFFFFFNDTATTEIYTLSLHDALPIYDTTTGALLGFSGTDPVGEYTGYPKGAGTAADEPLTQNRPLMTIKYAARDRKSTRLNSSHANISYAVFCLKKKTKQRGIPKDSP